MTTQPTYYTPSIEEFHVGFEVQVFHKHSEIGWEDEIYDELTPIWFNTTIEYLINNKKVRVKFLDQSDIEAEGWKHFPGGNLFTFLDKKNDSERFDDVFEINISGNEYRILIHYRTLTVNIKIDRQCLFNGIIRNRSELRRIMKMIGIKK